MKQFQHVIWSEGMFLMPEHFQASDRAAEQNLHFRFTASTFANWGFTKLEINLDKLANGTFEIISAEGIFPDGLAFSMPGNDDLPSGCAIDSSFPATQKFVDVWLVVPAEQPNGSNFLLGEDEQSGTSCRYRSRTLPVRNENLDPETAQEEPKPLQIGIRNFRILFSFAPDSLNGFEHLRMGRIQRGAGGKFELDESSVPPCLDFAISPYLNRLLERRVEKLTARSRKLADRRRLDLGGPGFANIQDQLLLLAINSFLPGLRHLNKVRMGHPELPYFQLLNLAGALSSFSQMTDMADLPVYDHKDIGLQYTELDQIIEKLLEPSTREKCVEIPLEREGLFWVASLNEKRYFDKGEFFIGIKGSMTVPDFVQAALKMKIASRLGIDQLYRSAVNGLGSQYEPVLPQVCPAKTGYQYFRLIRNGPFWKEIETSASIGIYTQMSNIEAEMLIALP